MKLTKNEVAMRDYLLQVEAELREHEAYYYEEEGLIRVMHDVADGIKYFLNERRLTEAEDE